MGAEGGCKRGSLEVIGDRGLQGSSKHTATGAALGKWASRTMRWRWGRQ